MIDKIFMKKTRRGNILKIVREHYLRDDINCGSELCQLESCKSQDSFKTSNTLDSKPNLNTNTLFTQPHYIMPDTNIILHQMDVLEDPIFKNVIITQTVLQETKTNSVSCYQRLVQLLNSPERRFFCFVNEYHKDTFVQRLDNESANDRNDRAIRHACKYYKSHLRNLVDCVLLSDDAQNRRLASDQGLLSASCREYVEGFQNTRPELLDRIAAKESKNDQEEIDEKSVTDLTRKNKHIIFPEHMSMTDIQMGLKSGKLFQGAYQSSRENYLEATVFLHDNEKCPQIFIQGYRNLNRAVHDDIVAIEILPKSEWATPTSLILEEAEEDVGDYVNEKVT
jgi:exosome complex exonuclease DIS3/RRP44